MARDLRSIDISEFPELLQLVEEMQADQTPRVLRRDNEEVAILTPAKRKRKRLPRGRQLTPDNPLWQLVGSVTDAGPTDASKKHEYLAEAYSPPES